MEFVVVGSFRWVGLLVSMLLIWFIMLVSRDFMCRLVECVVVGLLVLGLVRWGNGLGMFLLFCDMLCGIVVWVVDNVGYDLKFGVLLVCSVGLCCVGDCCEMGV